MPIDESESDDPAPGPDDLTPDDPTPTGIDQPEAELLPDDPADDLGPDAPPTPDLASKDVDPEIKKQFWSLVLLFNVALFAMSLGLMFVGFEGRWKLGGGLFAVGVVAFARGWAGYRDVTSE